MSDDTHEETKNCEHDKLRFLRYDTEPTENMYEEYKCKLCGARISYIYKKTNRRIVQDHRDEVVEEHDGDKGWVVRDE